VIVTNELDFELRQKQWAEEDAKKEAEAEEARKNKNFTQVYPNGWKRILELSKTNSSAAGLYAFFAQHIDPSCGAIACDQQFLADQFKVNTRTIRRWLDFLEEQNALVRIPVAGKICAYALDPYEVWKGYDTQKEYAAFITKTLVNKDGEIKRRLMAMFSNKQQAE
jgi:5'-deoxynucleotidase YfbR-like HD superfamily hydrolase